MFKRIQLFCFLTGLFAVSAAWAQAPAFMVPDGPIPYVATGEGGPARQVFTVSVTDDVDAIGSGIDLDILQTGDDFGLLGINNNTGLVRFRDAVVYDPDADNLLEFTVRATDSDANFTDQVYQIQIVGPNTAPVIVNDGATVTVDVPTTTGGGARIAATAEVTDDSDSIGNGLTFSQTDASGGNGSFGIGQSGNILFNSNVIDEPELFAGNTYAVEFSVTDSDGAVTVGTITIAVNELPNEAPVIENDGATFTVDVPTTTGDGARIAGNAIVSDDSDEIGDGLVFEQTDASAGRGFFGIGQSGNILFNSNVIDEPELFAGNTYAVQFSVTDSDGAVTVGTITIAVNELPNEAPVIENDGSSVTVVIPTTTGDGARIAATAEVSDDSDEIGDGLVFNQTEESAGKEFFGIGQNGNILFDSPRVFDNPEDYIGETFAVEFTVEDSEGAITTGTINITVTAANEAPVIENDGSSVTVVIPTTTGDGARIAATAEVSDDSDEIGDGLVFNQTEESAGKEFFGIGQNGNILFDSPRVFDNPEDYIGETFAVEFTVEDSEGAITTGTINITVTAANEAPVIENDDSSVTVVIPTTTGNGARIAATAEVSDDSDEVGDGLVFNQTEESAGKEFFGIGQNGNILFDSPRVFDNPEDYIGETFAVEFSVTDSEGATTVGIINITVTAANEAPVIENDGASVTVVIPTTTGNGARIAATAEVSDDSDEVGDGLVFNQTEESAGKQFFGIGQNGNILFDSPRVFDNPEDYIGNTFAVEFSVTDSEGATTVGIINITVTAANEAPVIENDGASVTVVIPTTTGNGARIAATAEVSDDSDEIGDGLVFNQTEESAGKQFFGIGQNGNILFDSPRVFDNPEDYIGETFAVEFSVTDSEGATTVGIINITVTAANEAPVIENDGASVTVVIPTTTGNGARIAATADVSDDSDAVGDGLVFDQTDDSEGREFFGIGQNGNILFNSPRVFDNPEDYIGNTFAVEFSVTDSEGATTIGTINITVTEAVTEVLVVTNFYLIDADTDERIQELPIDAETVIDINSLPTTNLNIEAVTTDDVESVYLELTGALSNTRTENLAPYALYGDANGGGDFYGEEFVVGSYSISATGYAGDNQSGDSGETKTAGLRLVVGDVADTTAPVIILLGDNPQEIELGDAYAELGATAEDNIDGDISDAIVIDASGVDTSTAGTYTVSYTVMDAAGNITSVTRTVTVVDTPDVLSVIEFYLIDADTDQRIMELVDGDYDISTLPGNLSIEAVATDDVESVYMQLSGALSATRTENVAPYALFGDANGGGDFDGVAFGEGSYTISGTPFTGDNQSGVQGEVKTVNFTLSSSLTTAAAPALSVYPNPAVESINVSVEDDAADVVAVQIYDFSGRLVKSVQLASGANVDVSDLQPGTYFMNTIDENGQEYQDTIIIN